MARFDFEGEHSDELSFSEGDVIKLKAYVGEEWVRGQVGTLTGIFPLNFVEIVEDLPPPASEQQPQAGRIALPGEISFPVDWLSSLSVARRDSALLFILNHLFTKSI